MEQPTKLQTATTRILPSHNPQTLSPIESIRLQIDAIVNMLKTHPQIKLNEKEKEFYEKIAYWMDISQQNEAFRKMLETSKEIKQSGTDINNLLEKLLVIVKYLKAREDFIQYSLDKRPYIFMSKEAGLLGNDLIKETFDNPPISTKDNKNYLKNTTHILQNHAILQATESYVKDYQEQKEIIEKYLIENPTILDLLSEGEKKLAKYILENPKPDYIQSYTEDKKTTSSQKFSKANATPEETIPKEMNNPIEGKVAIENLILCILELGKENLLTLYIKSRDALINFVKKEKELFLLKEKTIFIRKLIEEKEKNLTGNVSEKELRTLINNIKNTTLTLKLPVIYSNEKKKLLDLIKLLEKHDIFSTYKDQLTKKQKNLIETLNKENTTDVQRIIEKGGLNEISRRNFEIFTLLHFLENYKIAQIKKYDEEKEFVTYNIPEEYLKPPLSILDKINNLKEVGLGLTLSVTDNDAKFIGESASNLIQTYKILTQNASSLSPSKEYQQFVDHLNTIYSKYEIAKEYFNLRNEFRIYEKDLGNLANVLSNKDLQFVYFLADNAVKKTDIILIATQQNLDMIKKIKALKENIALATYEELRDKFIGDIKTLDTWKFLTTVSKEDPKHRPCKFIRKAVKKLEKEAEKEAKAEEQKKATEEKILKEKLSDAEIKKQAQEEIVRKRGNLKLIEVCRKGIEDLQKGVYDKPEEEIKRDQQPRKESGGAVKITESLTMGGRARGGPSANPPPFKSSLFPSAPALVPPPIKHSSLREGDLVGYIKIPREKEIDAINIPETKKEIKFLKLINHKKEDIITQVGNITPGDENILYLRDFKPNDFSSQDTYIYKIRKIQEREKDIGEITVDFTNKKEPKVVSLKIDEENVQEGLKNIGAGTRGIQRLSGKK